MPVTYEKWDGTPFGGYKSKKDILKKYGLRETDVCYVLRDPSGKITHFQWHKPFIQGIHYMTEADWEAEAKAHAERINKREKEMELRLKTGTHMVEVMVEARHKEAVERYHQDLVQQHPVEIDSKDEALAKEMKLNYRLKEVTTK